MVALFWISVAGVFYPYFGYPLLLALWGAVKPWPVRRGADRPSVSLIIPVHNEAARIVPKIENTAALSYPRDRLEVLFVSDGCTDDTVPLLRRHMSEPMRVIELRGRGGKAAGLNAGLAEAKHDILVFSDAAISLEPESLQRLVSGFADPVVGCISGEDRIADSGGEGLYGRYELMLRRLESQVHSIVGASGSFYAQRRSLCRPFTEGMAPDFLSVLRTVEQGYRAISEPSAVGAMTSVTDPRQEFERKVRTLIRGMTTLFAYSRTMNPFRFGAFAFALLSHKVMRWLAPVFLIGAFVAPLGLLRSPFYTVAFLVQALGYGVAIVAGAGVPSVRRSLIGKVALYFSSVNAAVLKAWWQYARGVRQELWTPSRR